MTTLQTSVAFLVFLNIVGIIAFMVLPVAQARKRFFWNVKHPFSKPNPYAQMETGKERVGYKDFLHSFKNVYREALRKMKLPEFPSDILASVIAVVMAPAQVVLALVAVVIGVFS